MTIQQFHLLNQVEKEELLFNDAVFIENYARGNLLFDVYRLNAFFVLCCYELNKNEKAIINAFNSVEELLSFKKDDLPDISSN